MSEIMKITNEEIVTMTSLEVVELINNFRKVSLTKTKNKNNK